MSVFEFLEMDGRDSAVVSVRSRLPKDPGGVGGVCMANEDSSPCISQGEGPDYERFEDVLCELGAGAELNLELDVRVEPRDAEILQGEELSWETNRREANEPEEHSNTSRSTASPEPTAASAGEGNDWLGGRSASVFDSRIEMQFCVCV